MCVQAALQSFPSCFFSWSLNISTGLSCVFNQSRTEFHLVYLNHTFIAIEFHDISPSHIFLVVWFLATGPRLFTRLFSFLLPLTLWLMNNFCHAFLFAPEYNWIPRNLSFLFSFLHLNNFPTFFFITFFLCLFFYAFPYFLCAPEQNFLSFCTWTKFNSTIFLFPTLFLHLNKIEFHAASLSYFLPVVWFMVNVAMLILALLLNILFLSISSRFINHYFDYNIEVKSSSIFLVSATMFIPALLLNILFLFVSSWFNNHYFYLYLHDLTTITSLAIFQ